MIWCRPIHDRRSSDRPSNGDRKVCPSCHNVSAEFNERYRLPTSNGRTPAWVCDGPGCGYSEPVRTENHRPLITRRRRMASMRITRRSKKSG
jgi:hypothetical protein